MPGNFCLSFFSKSFHILKYQVPCEYTEYKIAGDPIISMERGQRKLILRMADTMGTLVSEQPLYSFVSFIAEFGGALGLFIGFSFLTFFDLFEMSQKYFNSMNS